MEFLNPMNINRKLICLTFHCGKDDLKPDCSVLQKVM